MGADIFEATAFYFPHAPAYPYVSVTRRPINLGAPAGTFEVQNHIGEWGPVLTYTCPSDRIRFTAWNVEGTLVRARYNPPPWAVRDKSWHFLPPFDLPASPV